VSAKKHTTVVVCASDGTALAMIDWEDTSSVMLIYLLGKEADD
jgi:hypothetical protein